MRSTSKDPQYQLGCAVLPKTCSIDEDMQQQRGTSSVLVGCVVLARNIFSIRISKEVQYH